MASPPLKAASRDDRLYNRIKAKFIETVNPKHLIPHLSLCISDEEEVLAAQQQAGQTNAAAELLRKICRHPDWFHHLLKALTNHSVGLEWLANEFEKCQAELLVEVNIHSVTLADPNGGEDINMPLDTDEDMEVDEVATPEQIMSFHQTLDSEQMYYDTYNEHMLKVLKQYVLGFINDLVQTPEQLTQILHHLTEICQTVCSGAQLGCLEFLLRVDSLSMLYLFEEYYKGGAIQDALEADLTAAALNGKMKKKVEELKIKSLHISVSIKEKEFEECVRYFRSIKDDEELENLFMDEEKDQNSNADENKDENSKLGNKVTSITVNQDAGENKDLVHKVIGNVQIAEKQSIDKTDWNYESLVREDVGASTSRNNENIEQHMLPKFKSKDEKIVIQGDIIQIIGNKKKKKKQEHRKQKLRIPGILNKLKIFKFKQKEKQSIDNTDWNSESLVREDVGSSTSRNNDAKHGNKVTNIIVNHGVQENKIVDQNYQRGNKVAETIQTVIEPDGDVIENEHQDYKDKNEVDEAVRLDIKYYYYYDTDENRDQKYQRGNTVTKTIPTSVKQNTDENNHISKNENRIILKQGTGENLNSELVHKVIGNVQIAEKQSIDKTDWNYESLVWEDVDSSTSRNNDAKHGNKVTNIIVNHGVQENKIVDQNYQRGNKVAETIQTVIEPDGDVIENEHQDYKDKNEVDEAVRLDIKYYYYYDTDENRDQKYQRGNTVTKTIPTSVKQNTDENNHISKNENRIILKQGTGENQNSELVHKVIGNVQIAEKQSIDKTDWNYESLVWEDVGSSTSRNNDAKHGNKVTNIIVNHGVQENKIVDQNYQRGNKVAETIQTVIEPNGDVIENEHQDYKDKNEVDELVRLNIKYYYYDTDENRDQKYQRANTVTKTIPTSVKQNTDENNHISKNENRIILKQGTGENQNSELVHKVIGNVQIAEKQSIDKTDWNYESLVWEDVGSSTSINNDAKHGNKVTNIIVNHGVQENKIVDQNYQRGNKVAETIQTVIEPDGDGIENEHQDYKDKNEVDEAVRLNIKYYYYDTDKNRDQKYQCGNTVTKTIPSSVKQNTDENNHISKNENRIILKQGTGENQNSELVHKVIGNVQIAEKQSIDKTDWNYESLVWEDVDSSTSRNNDAKHGNKVTNIIVNHGVQENKIVDQNYQRGNKVAETIQTVIEPDGDGIENEHQDYKDKNEVDELVRLNIKYYYYDTDENRDQKYQRGKTVTKTIPTSVKQNTDENNHISKNENRIILKQGTGENQNSELVHKVIGNVQIAEKQSIDKTDWNYESLVWEDVDSSTSRNNDTKHGNKVTNIIVNHGVQENKIVDQNYQRGNKVAETIQTVIEPDGDGIENEHQDYKDKNEVDEAVRLNIKYYYYDTDKNRDQKYQRGNTVTKTIPSSVKQNTDENNHISKNENRIILKQGTGENQNSELVHKVIGNVQIAEKQSIDKTDWNYESLVWEDVDSSTSRNNDAKHGNKVTNIIVNHGVQENKIVDQNYQRGNKVAETIQTVIEPDGDGIENEHQDYKDKNEVDELVRLNIKYYYYDTDENRDQKYQRGKTVTKTIPTSVKQNTDENNHISKNENRIILKQGTGENQNSELVHKVIGNVQIAEKQSIDKTDWNYESLVWEDVDSSTSRNNDTKHGNKVTNIIVNHGVQENKIVDQNYQRGNKVAETIQTVIEPDGDGIENEHQDYKDKNEVDEAVHKVIGNVQIAEKQSIDKTDWNYESLVREDVGSSTSKNNENIEQHMLPKFKSKDEKIVIQGDIIQIIGNKTNKKKLEHRKQKLKIPGILNKLKIFKFKQKEKQSIDKTDWNYDVGSSTSRNNENIEQHMLPKFKSKDGKIVIQGDIIQIIGNKTNKKKLEHRKQKLKIPGILNKLKIFKFKQKEKQSIDKTDWNYDVGSSTSRNNENIEQHMLPKFKSKDGKIVIHDDISEIIGSNTNKKKLEHKKQKSNILFCCVRC